MAYDEFGNWVDEGETYGYDDPSLYNNPWMQQQMPGQNFSTAKWNFGAPQPVGQNVYNQILTGQKNQAQLFTNPAFRYAAMVDTGQMTMDPNGLMGLDASGNPYLGGGGGGGGGNDFGYQPVFRTPTLDSLRGGGPIQNLILQGVEGGKNSAVIKNDLLGSQAAKDAGFTTEDFNAFNQTIDDAFHEKANLDLNNARGVAAGSQQQQTPIQEWLSKNGLINPIQQYTADNLPGDVDTSWANTDLRNAGNTAITQATQAGATLKRLHGQMGDLRTNMQLADAVRQAQQKAAQLNYMRDAARNEGGGVAPGNATYMPGAGGTPITVAGANQPPSPTPRSAGGTAGGGILSSLFGPAQQQIQTQLNPGGGQAQMRHLQNAAKLQEQRKRDQMASAASAPAYGDAVRQLAARQVQQSGRTPARDAQRVLLNYMRQGGGMGM